MHCAASGSLQTDRSSGSLSQSWVNQLQDEQLRENTYLQGEDQHTDGFVAAAVAFGMSRAALVGEETAIESAEGDTEMMPLDQPETVGVEVAAAAAAGIASECTRLLTQAECRPLMRLVRPMATGLEDGHQTGMLFAEIGSQIRGLDY